MQPDPGCSNEGWSLCSFHTKCSSARSSLLQFSIPQGSKSRASFAVLFQSLACSFSGSQPVHLQSSLVLLLPCRNGGVDAGIGVAGSLRPHFRLPVCVPGLVLCPTQEQLLKSCSFGGDACASWSKSQWQGLCCRWESLAGDVSPMAIG